MTLLATRQIKIFKQISFILPSTTIIYCSLLSVPNHIFFRTYTARKPVKNSKLSAPIYAEKELEDGSIFVSRVPLSPQKISFDDLPPPLKPIKEKSYHLTQEQINEIKQLREQD